MDTASEKSNCPSLEPVPQKATPQVTLPLATVGSFAQRIASTTAPRPGTVMLAVLPPYAAASGTLALAEPCLSNTIFYRPHLAEGHHLPMSAAGLQITSPIDPTRPHQLVLQPPSLVLSRPTPTGPPPTTAASPGQEHESVQSVSVMRVRTPPTSSTTPPQTLQANFPLSPHGAARISPIAAAPVATGGGAWVHTASGHLAFVRPEFNPATQGAQRTPMDVRSQNAMMSPPCGYSSQARMAPASLQQPAGHSSNQAAIAVYPGGPIHSSLGHSRLPPGYMMASIPGHPGIPALALSRFQSTKRARECTKPLKEWLLKNRRKPYPTRMEKAHLRDMTGLTFNQVSMWFANARRRIKKVGIESWARAALSGEDSLLTEEDWLDQEDSKIDSDDKEDDSKVRSEPYTSVSSPHQSFGELSGGQEHQQTRLTIADEDDTITSSSIHHGYSPMAHDGAGSAGDYTSSTPGLDYHMSTKPMQLASTGSDATCFQLPPSYMSDNHRPLANLDTPRSPQTMSFAAQRHDTTSEDLHEMDITRSGGDHAQEPLARRPYDPSGHSLPAVDTRGEPYLPQSADDTIDKPNMYFYSQSSDQQVNSSAHAPQYSPVATATCQLPPLASPPATLYQTTPYYGVPAVSLIQPSYVIPSNVTTLTGTSVSVTSAY